MLQPAKGPALEVMPKWGQGLKACGINSSQEQESATINSRILGTTPAFRSTFDGVTSPMEFPKHDAW